MIDYRVLKHQLAQLLVELDCHDAAADVREDRPFAERMARVALRARTEVALSRDLKSPIARRATTALDLVRTIYS